MSHPTYDHLSSLRVMFVFVFFDLPVKTVLDRKSYTIFRKRLMCLGFQGFQNSVYTRDCASHEIANKYTAYVQQIVPAKGHVSILRVTEMQLLKMINIYRNEPPKPAPKPRRQLTLL